MKESSDQCGSVHNQSKFLTSIIQCYSQTNKVEEQGKEELYGILQTELKIIKFRNMTVTLLSSWEISMPRFYTTIKD